MGQPLHRIRHNHTILPDRILLHTTKPNQQKHLPIALRSNLTVLRNFNGPSTSTLRSSLRNNRSYRHNGINKTLLCPAKRGSTHPCEIQTQNATGKQRIQRYRSCLVIFMLLVSSFAFSPSTGGTPRAISQRICTNCNQCFKSSSGWNRPYH